MATRRAALPFHFAPPAGCEWNANWHAPFGTPQLARPRRHTQFIQGRKPALCNCGLPLLLNKNYTPPSAHPAYPRAQARPVQLRFTSIAKQELYTPVCTPQLLRPRRHTPIVTPPSARPNWYAPVSTPQFARPRLLPPIVNFTSFFL